MSKDITDEQRREVARRLRDREATKGMDGRRFRSDRDMCEWLQAQLFWIQTCLIPAFHRTETMGFEKLLDALADLVDRPTCTPEVGLEQQTCSECGAECIDGWANYCSNCGAEVVR